MDKYDKKDPKSIEQFAKILIDHTLSDFLDQKTRKEYKKATTKRKKGNFGQLLEEKYFGIRPGGDKTPDFKEAGVELKSSPLKRTKDGLWSKERLVLNIINYVELINETWEGSSFLKKNSLLLLIFYLFEKNLPFIDYMIRHAGLWTIPKEDIEIIKGDWQKIREKVKQGLAHEISEGDTLYLAACTKGATKESVRKQPLSNIMAKQRAFAFKQKYVNYIIREFVERHHFYIGDSDKVVKDISIYKKLRTFEDVVLDRFSPYLNATIAEIARKLQININPKAKNYNDVLTRNILGVIRSKIEEFEKADIEVKSIILEPNNTLRESISFPAFDYKALAKEKEWGQSELKQMFEKRFFFVIYKKNGAGDKILKKAMFWTMPYNDLNREARWVWEETIKRIKKGQYDNMPKLSDNKVSHVRPHAINKMDVCETPNGKFVTKKCFWLNAKYIQGQIGTID